MTLLSLIRDWLLERRIDSKRSQVNCAWDAGNSSLVRQTYDELIALVNSRSPKQIKRMEREQGLYRGTNQNN